MVDAKPKSVRGRFATRRESGIADSDLRAICTWGSAVWLGNRGFWVFMLERLIHEQSTGEKVVVW